ncbi:MAG: SMC-Scp complex subunit ScpB [Candidatus Uhrbacteria bacterium]
MSKSSTQRAGFHRAIEALLFLADRPLTIRKVAEFLGTDQDAAREAIEVFQATWNARGGGTVVLLHDNAAQVVTAPDLHEFVETYARDEVRGELTRPQLETLTVIVYRGPITKAELEQIRGVHCGLILRNLLIRGLIEQRRDQQRHEDIYTASMDFLRHLGVTNVHELPNYEVLHAHPTIAQYLEQVAGAASATESSGGGEVVQAPPV